MTPVNPSQALAETLVDELARCGLRHAVVAPGSRSAPLALAVARDDRVRVHVVLDERSAAFLALGIGRATRRPAVVVSTSGTAAANFHPAVCEADAGRVPLLVVTADRPPELRAAGANQTMDQTHLYGRAVRAFAELLAERTPDAPRHWRSRACHAWARALGPPAGPVHLDVALRDPLVPEPDELGWPYGVGGRPDGRPWTSFDAAPPRLPDAARDRITELIAAHERGVVVAGDAVLDDPGAPGALAAAAGYPLLAEPMSGARRGPDAVSTYDSVLRSDRFAAAHRPDVVVRLGRANVSKALARWIAASGAREVVVDAAGEWLDPGRSAAEIVAADPSSACRALAHAVGGARSSQWRDRWRAAERAARSAVDAVLDDDDEPSEPRTARDVAALAPHGSTLVVASSMPVRDLDAYMAPRAGLRVLSSRGLSGIDGFVSTALGAACASDEPVLALAGDLSLLHDQNGLTLADRAGVDLVLVVLNNDGGGIFSFLPQARFSEHFETLFGTPHGIDLAHVAAVYGCRHVALARAGDLARAVDEARAAGGIQVIEVRTDRAVNVALHRRLVAAATAAVDALP
ncbi:MAG TPA: 2-succinyl-5-enolpyruvyl-6-hydroxy-3-cyclohexene-1-carboxylic-acid synthase [Actinomycetota bacterium]|nr:2-succinyl-5-enolpyruvyl-6-hydroxy-3-cyclohexene-1-carboxylic-acid synthase [Actinomycetota bacterium]